MEGVSEIFHNQILVVSLLACFTAQGLKVIIELIRDRELNFRYLVTTGGMPSAHSALVGALAAGIGQTMGWSSPDFAIACLFAVIVMYDAAGVRQAAGKQAKILNQMTRILKAKIDRLLVTFKSLDIKLSAQFSGYPRKFSTK